jgi:hypothetical protein
MQFTSQEEAAAKAKAAAKPTADDDVLELNEDGSFDATKVSSGTAAAVAPATKADAWSLPQVPASVLEDARVQAEELKEKEDEEDKTPARKCLYTHKSG